jgi:hypothetical protein
VECLSDAGTPAASGENHLHTILAHRQHRSLSSHSFHAYDDNPEVVTS